MKQVLVTGGAGFIGSHLTEALVAGGAQVTVLDDLSNGFAANLDPVLGEIRFVEGSIVDLELVSRLAHGCDTIFHLAAVSNVVETVENPVKGHAVNGTGTFNVLLAAREHGARVVYSSSAAVYGSNQNVPLEESEPTGPLSPYGSQKLLGELYMSNFCDLYGLTGVALRYFNVYGPRQRPDSPYSGVISIFADRAGKGLDISIHGDGGQTRDFVHVSDVVRANILAATSPLTGFVVCNVCTGLPTSVKELAELLIDLNTSQGRLGFGPPRAGDIRLSLGDPGRAEKTIGFQASVILKQGLAGLVSQ